MTNAYKESTAVAARRRQYVYVRAAKRAAERQSGNFMQFKDRLVVATPKERNRHFLSRVDIQRRFNTAFSLFCGELVTFNCYCELAVPDSMRRSGVDPATFELF